MIFRIDFPHSLPVCTEGGEDYCNQFRIFISLAFPFMDPNNRERFRILSTLPASAPHTSFSIPFVCCSERGAKKRLSLFRESVHFIAQCTRVCYIRPHERLINAIPFLSNQEATSPTKLFMSRQSSVPLHLSDSIRNLIRSRRWKVSGLAEFAENNWVSIRISPKLIKILSFCFWLTDAVALANNPIVMEMPDILSQHAVSLVT